MDPMHHNTNLIIAEQYQCHPPIMALDMEMDLMYVDFVSALAHWVDDMYDYLIVGRNAEEDMWWITTRVIRSIFEEYMAPYRATPTRTSFGSYPHCWSTMVWGVIRCHIYEENIL